MKNALLIGIIALAYGCTGVYSKMPVGKTQKNLAAEIEEWTGAWDFNGSAITLAPADPEKGALTAAWVEQGKTGFEFKTAEITLRTAGNWTFVNMKESRPGQENRYIWGRIKKEKRSAVAWLPDTDKFKRLIQEGRLPGTAPTNSSPAVLDALSPEQLALVMSEQQGLLFKWDHPLVFKKISD